MSNLIDVPRSAYLWTVQERDLYNRLPIYMAEMDVKLNKRYQRWTKLLKSINWQRNQGFTLQGVHKDRTPVLTSEFLPQPITSTPRKNVVEVRELQERAQLYREHVESNLFHFLPVFADFLTDGIDKTQENINEQQAILTDQFYRTAILHGAPKIWVCGKPAGTELTTVPHWVSSTGAIALSKTPATMQALANVCTEELNLRTLAKIAMAASIDLDIEPFSGSVLADGSSGSQLQHKWCLVTGLETWGLFQFDSFVADNRPLNMNIVTEAFKGDIFGVYTTMLERHPMHMKLDGTFPAPEVVEGTTDAYDVGRSKPNPSYASITESPYTWSFLVGAEAYKAIRPGPPPQEFSGMSMKQFASLDWNGKARITTNVNVPALDQAGNAVTDTNKYGDYLQMISDLVMGIVPIARHRIVPILHLRKRVQS